MNINEGMNEREQDGFCFSVALIFVMLEPIHCT